MIKTNKDGQVPYTPVLPLLYGMQASMKLMRAEGFENVIKRHHRYVVAVCMAARIAAQSAIICAFSAFALLSIVLPCLSWVEAKHTRPVHISFSLTGKGSWCVFGVKNGCFVS